MSKKIVAIGGGENGRVSSKHGQMPYETKEIDEEIVRLSEKEHPNFLFLAHSQIPFGEDAEKNYYEVIKKIYENLGCEVRWLKVSELKEDKQKAINDVKWADIIYEGGGATDFMINFWKETGFDKILRKAYEEGKIISGISAGCIAWFTYGNTLNPELLKAECNKTDGLGFVDAYVSPHCQYEGKRESEIRSLKYIDKVGISLSNCCAIEIVDNEYRIIKSTPDDKSFEPYALKTYWDNGEMFEEEIINTQEFKSLDDLLSKNIKEVIK